MLKLARCFLVAMVGLISTAHCATTFIGTAQTVDGSPDGNSPFMLKMNGKKITGAIFSNSLGRRIAIRGTVDAAGNFRALVKKNGLIGRFKGKMSSNSLRGTGRLQGNGIDATSLRLQAKVRALRIGQPDFSGTIKFIHCDQVGVTGIGYMTLEMKRTRKLDYWLGTVGVAANQQAPIEFQFSEERKLNVKGPDVDGLSIYGISFRDFASERALFANVTYDEIDEGIYLVSAECGSRNSRRPDLDSSLFRRYLAFK